MIKKFKWPIAIFLAIMVLATGIALGTPAMAESVSQNEDGSVNLVVNTADYPAATNTGDLTTQGDTGGVYARLIALKSKYPDGQYWNHYVSALSECADALTDNRFGDSVTTTPCYDHWPEDASELVGHYDCNYYDGGWQCFGFANRIFAEIFGISARDQTNHYDTNIAVGDWVRVNNDHHSGIVLTLDGDTFTMAEANMDSHCKIRWGCIQYDKDDITYYKHASNYDDFVGADTTKPTATAVSFSDIDETGFTVTLSGAKDNVGVSRVAFAVWTLSDDQDDLLWQNGTYADGVWRLRVNVADHNGESGTYVCHAYVYDAAGNYCMVGATEVIDLSAPVITNVAITNVTQDGYTVSCTVTDDVGVTKVQCPNWTMASGQDDLADYWETNSKVTATQKGTTWTYTVKRSEHSGEYGTYVTHIYAYDAAGHVSFVSAGEVTLQKRLTGDINGDGLVNASDALMVLQCAVGNITLTTTQKGVADTNGDGLINAGDALKILRIAVGLE